MEGMQSVMQDEVGATDNRLSLNPNQFEGMKDWTDGEEYTMTVKVRQVAAGEFQVLDAQPQPAEENPEPGTEQQPEAEPTENEKEAGGPPSNPAVRSMMAGKKY